MFESASMAGGFLVTDAPEPPGPTTPTPPTLQDLQHAQARLAAVDGVGCDEAALIDHLRVLEELKAGIAAAQARVTMTLVHARTTREAAAGVPTRERCQGLAGEIALARRQSPHHGARDLGMARGPVHEMPATLAALTAGQISEWRATLLVRETAVLSREHRGQVDAELDGQLPQLGDRAAAAAARGIGYRLDPGSAIRRTRGANSDRYVSVRPAPDAMTYLTGLLPVAQGVACHTALRKHADSLRAGGDPRTRGQIMADTLVERLTGQVAAETVDVEVDLVMSEATLLAGDQTPATIPGFGPVPAHVARDLVNDAARAWLRRLHTHPADGTLVAMDSTRRGFSGELRHALVLRDQTCRTPWCDAPIRHADHVTRASDGGSTTADNGQGLCETCNYTKESPGWTARRLDTRRHLVEITTPTGHRYRSTAPDPPGAAEPTTELDRQLERQLQRLRQRVRARPSPLEHHLRELTAA